MDLACRTGAAWLTVCGLLVLCGARVAQAQIFPPQFELSDSVHLDEVDSAARAHLERVKAYVADGQWDEAVETLRQVMQTHAGKVINLTGRRYISLADYCHLQIAALPPAALELYRQRVDPIAQKWYDEGVAARDPALLSNVVQQMFCATTGDDALFALGEIALEEGRPSVARGYWERIVERPPERVAAAEFDAALAHARTTPAEREVLNAWYRKTESPDTAAYHLRHDEYLPDDAAGLLVRFWKQAGLSSSRLAYPDTTLELAAVRARLVLASILEGSLDRARTELDAFRHLHPATTGMLAGRSGALDATLEQLLTDAAKWPAQTQTDDWPTFAGNPARNKIARDSIFIGARPRWEIKLGEPLMADVTSAARFNAHRIGERSDGLLSYHPLVYNNLAFACNQQQIFAFDLATGQPAWPTDPKKRPGEVYSEELPGNSASRTVRGLGVPRFTMTAAGGKLYARMGTQVTGRPIESFDLSTGKLVCLDLQAQGRLLWKIAPEDEKWAFEGAPLVSGTDVYIAMRKSDVRPQAHVACFDVETGRRRWRTMISSAETPAGGQAEELTHNLLTLEQGVLYLNTNLGAVAAITARDGHLEWISTYPRAKRTNSTPADKHSAHFYRDLNPCVYYRGTLLVAPSDCEHLLALDAATGQILWQTGLAADAVHLLGVGEGNLIASGEFLWWIDVEQGKVVARWPDQSPHGYGRGLLAGDKIYWPTRDTLYVFEQRVSRPGEVPLAGEPILLGAEARGAGGGNLVAAQNLLLLATDQKLFAFGPPGEAKPAKVAPARSASRAASPLPNP